MKITLTTLLCCLLAAAHAQILLTGIVQDETGTPLPGATVMFTHLTPLGIVTNETGAFSCEIPDSICHRELELKVTYLGFMDELIIVNTGCISKDIGIINMQPHTMVMHSVVIEHLMVSSAMGVVRQGKKGRIKNTQRYDLPYNDEYYKGNTENTFQSVTADPMTTLSIDVDHASYSNIRRMLNEGSAVPPDAVRIEEMINYFQYAYPEPAPGEPYAIYTEVSACPWNPQHQLLHVGVRAKQIPAEALPATNFVFLIDVSGSMGVPNKLPLVQASLKLLVNNLREQDRVAIVVYAGAAGEVLKSTSGAHKEKILDALSQLQAGGSTAGGEGIQLAYDIAEKNFIRDGNNRIILCTDGDFNVGVSSDDELTKLITAYRDNGIYLTCLGYGMGNFKDAKLEILADKGNGNYGYIDNMQEANKLLVAEFGATMFTVAKDMKMQIEFNPSVAAAYRLIGYENRLLRDEDFSNDKVDAGDLGAGQSVTTLYEIIPVGVEDTFTANIPEFKYQHMQVIPGLEQEVATIKVRYKEPDAIKSKEASYPIRYAPLSAEQSSEDFRFSAAVALFGMLLQESKYAGTGNYAMVEAIAGGAKSNDRDGYRAEFVRLSQTVH